MPARVAILHQGCVPTYRRAFFERLARSRDCEYVVFHGEAEPGSGMVAAPMPYAFPNVPVKNRFIRVLGRLLVYQPVFKAVAGGDFDALVIGHEVKYVASFALLAYFRLRGRPVLLWGFGKNRDPFSRNRFGAAVGRLVARAQLAMVRLATDFMAYTEMGAAQAVEAGMPADRVSVLNNTIDISQEVEAHARTEALDRSALRREFGLSASAIVLLFIGRLNAAKKVSRLIEAARSLRMTHGLELEVLIVGTGPEEQRLREIAEGEGWCRFLGSIQAIDPLSRIFRVSDALVIPGYVGLAVNHAFAHGLPLITCASETHSPEIEYAVDGVNGLIVASESDLENGLERFAMFPALRARLSAGALATRTKLDIQPMVDTFDDSVRRALRRSAPVAAFDARHRSP